MPYLCRGYAKSGKCRGPMLIDSLNEEAAAHEYAAAVWDTLDEVVTAVEVNGNRYRIDLSIEFIVRPVGVAVHT